MFLQDVNAPDGVPTGEARPGGSRANSGMPGKGLKLPPPVDPILTQAVTGHEKGDFELVETELPGVDRVAGDDRKAPATRSTKKKQGARKNRR